jgi:hypothetical protein
MMANADERGQTRMAADRLARRSHRNGATPPVRDWVCVDGEETGLRNLRRVGPCFALETRPEPPNQTGEDPKEKNMTKNERE